MEGSQGSEKKNNSEQREAFVLESRGMLTPFSVDSLCSLTRGSTC